MPVATVPDGAPPSVAVDVLTGGVPASAVPAPLVDVDVVTGGVATTGGTSPLTGGVTVEVVVGGGGDDVFGSSGARCNSVEVFEISFVSILDISDTSVSSWMLLVASSVGGASSSGGGAAVCTDAASAAFANSSFSCSPVASSVRWTVGRTGVSVLVFLVR